MAQEVTEEELRQYFLYIKLDHCVLVLVSSAAGGRSTASRKKMELG
jgi:hypothetical protein